MEVSLEICISWLSIFTLSWFPLSFEILCHITSCIFQRMFRKTHVLKISADSQKNVFVKFFLSSLSCWIHHLYIYWKLNPSQMFVTVSRIFKIAIRVSCGETNSKVAWEFFAFYNFAKYSIILLLVFQKAVLPEISKNFLLTGVASL